MPHHEKDPSKRNRFWEAAERIVDILASGFRTEYESQFIAAVGQTGATVAPTGEIVRRPEVYRQRRSLEEPTGIAAAIRRAIIHRQNRRESSKVLPILPFNRYGSAALEGVQNQSMLPTDMLTRIDIAQYLLREVVTDEQITPEARELSGILLTDIMGQIERDEDDTNPPTFPFGVRLGSRINVLARNNNSISFVQQDNTLFERQYTDQQVADAWQMSRDLFELADANAS